MADTAASAGPVPLLSLGFDRQTWGLVLEANLFVIGAATIAFVLALFVLRRWVWRRVELFDVEGTELGVGPSKITFKPNYTDRQVAYQVWVELSTRKIGLEIDPEHDVIAEVYDSWHAFFGVTRELIKSIPVNKVSRESTKKVVNLSIDVLNLGIRPHLTRWQARFRTWYERQLASQADKEPQEIQRMFPAYEELRADLIEVNRRLISYRGAMYQLVYGSKATAQAAVAIAEDVVAQPPAN